MIDVPICFKKTKSIKFKNFELPLLKFTNLLMRKGKKEKMIKTLFLAFFSFIHFLKTNFFFKSILFKN
jgi:ribosomal protein S7